MGDVLRRRETIYLTLDGAHLALGYRPGALGVCRCRVSEGFGVLLESPFGSIVQRKRERGGSFRFRWKIPLY